MEYVIYKDGKLIKEYTNEYKFRDDFINNVRKYGEKRVSTNIKGLIVLSRVLKGK